MVDKLTLLQTHVVGWVKLTVHLYRANASRLEVGYDSAHRERRVGRGTDVSAP